MKPPIKLIMTLTYFARKYVNKIMHFNDPHACAGFLGGALKDQRKLIEDSDSGTFMTLYDSLERLLEIKVLTHWTASKFGLDTKGKAPAVIMHEIAELCEADSEVSSKEIRETLKWAEEFFSKPEVQEIFNEADIEIQMPKNPLQLPKTVMSMGMRIQQEATRLHRVLNVAKGKTPPKKDDGGGHKPPSI